MRKLTRGVVAGAMSAPLLMAAAGVASADDVSFFEKRATFAGPNGAGTARVQSFAYSGNIDRLGEGEVTFFEAVKTRATPKGTKAKLARSYGFTGDLGMGALAPVASPAGEIPLAQSAPETKSAPKKAVKKAAKIKKS